MKKMWLVIALFLGFSGAAHAGVMIEPYLGYEMGKFSGSNNIEGKTSMVNMGARLAYTLPVLFWIGVDGNIGVSGDFKSDNANPDSGIKRTSYFGVVGVDLPILLRGWVGYGFSNHLKMDKDNLDAQGTATKIGLGFTALPFLSINLEYIKDNVDKVTKDSGDITSPSTDHSSYMLSVSLPLSF